MGRPGIIAASAALFLCGGPVFAFEPGPRPPGAVFDPAGLLDHAERMEISTPLEKIHKDDNVEVVAVVLTEREAGVPGETARRMAAAWCSAPLHAVVLHVPGMEGGPWIAAGGGLAGSFDPAELRDELDAARRAAARESDDVSKLRVAANATADMLRYWTGRETTRQWNLENQRALIRLELETKARRRQILMLAALAAAIPVIAGAVIAFRLMRKARRESPQAP